MAHHGLELGEGMMTRSAALCRLRAQGRRCLMAEVDAINLKTTRFNTPPGEKST